jgi:hypothetical protein
MPIIWYSTNCSANAITSSTAATIYWPVWQDAAFSVTSGTSTNSPTASAIYYPIWHDAITAPAIVGRQAAMEEEADRSREKARRRWALANECAKQILLDHLTAEQRETVEKNGWFVIQGGESGKLYRIGMRSIAGNVEELDADGRAVARFCCHLNDAIPHHDHHLAQKLMLEWEEETFLRLANRR